MLKKIVAPIIISLVSLSSILPVVAAPWESEPNYITFKMGKTYHGFRIGETYYRYGIINENAKRYRFGEVQLPIYARCNRGRLSGNIAITLTDRTSGQQLTKSVRFGDKEGTELNTDGSWKVYVTGYEHYYLGQRANLKIDKLDAYCPDMTVQDDYGVFRTFKAETF
jgi:hypothetical protein